MELGTCDHETLFYKPLQNSVWKEENAITVKPGDGFMHMKKSQIADIIRQMTTIQRRAIKIRFYKIYCMSESYLQQGWSREVLITLPQEILDEWDGMKF